MTALNTTAIVVSKPGSNGADYLVQVFDKTNTNGFGEVASAWGNPINQASVTLVDTGTPNTIIFAVTNHNGAGNLQIQLWKYVRP